MMQTPPGDVYHERELHGITLDIDEAKSPAAGPLSVRIMMVAREAGIWILKIPVLLLSRQHLVLE